MTREGNFMPKYSTLNQCKDRGHLQYEYICRIRFNPQLDSKGFLIDHQDIDDAINSIENVGSCEECLLAMFDRVKKVLPLSAIHLQIEARPKDAKAFLILNSKL